MEYNSIGQIEKEDHSGSITYWKYDARGFPMQKTQVTGTSDPDVVIEYSYNNQGQCIQTTRADSIQENVYDIMGNAIQSQLFSSSGTLLSATYVGYNLNNQPIWKQTANANNTLYLDYHASGLLKVSGQSLRNGIAYTLYEYDSRGYLIEEVDPLGYCTYRDYDAQGNVTCKTKEKHSTLFSYEPGGLIESIISPSGAQIKRLYTSNGLLKEESYPNGTKSSSIYDFLGRPIQEMTNGIAWEIKYDDAKNQVIRTHVETQVREIREFDARGNLICFTDSADYNSEKTYDGLNRVKTETTPSGEQTTWSYQGDMIICSLPNGEKIAKRYAGGRVIESEIIDALGNLIASSAFRYNPETDVQEVLHGEEITSTAINSFGLPTYTQKGNITITYEYDSCGNCTASTDGQERITRQTFDGLQRMIQKELPDGSTLGFIYDLDSNLIECHLPNGVLWKASYDLMGRKCFEELQARGQSSQTYEYTYENGYLKETKDPMQRTHTYLYDSHGRLIQENALGWQRNFTYDRRGLLSSLEQIGAQSSAWFSHWFYTPHPENSRIERSYDADGRLIAESIFLNSQLIQQTQQTWIPSGRSLKIGDHERNFMYQNNQLIQVSAHNIDLSYAYDLSGSLLTKTTPLSTATIDYNTSGLPENVYTDLPDESYQESLEWDPSGKLAAYASLKQQKHFTYTSRGQLQSAGEEKYAFDFGLAGTGVRTKAPNWHIPQEGLDAFSKIMREISNKNSLSIAYDPIGQVIFHQQKKLEWDPWGRLLTVTDKTYTWEASYDALGRRLQTRYTPNQGTTLTTFSFYDPEEEFQEIGITCQDKTFWKIYGPNSCDALTDETVAVFPIDNALRQLERIVTEQETLCIEQFPSAYGPQSAPSIASDLLTFAKQLNWHSKSPDPTGLIWMGKRYYDPKGGRFLSPDPIGYPICLDLYAYANGDPINHMDPDGRFASHVYKITRPSIIPMVNSLSATFANHHLTHSKPYQVGSFTLANGAIGFTNGINNQQNQVTESAIQLSRHAQGFTIHGIYNATNSLPVDVLECALGRAGVHTPPVQHLKNKWRHLKDTHGPNAKFLEICHRGGAEHLKNALETSPESVQQIIIALAIAPSVIIPRKLCFRSNNYISRRDFVTHLDILGKMKYGNELKVLEPHPNAHTWDHEFLSPTFEDPIQ